MLHKIAPLEQANAELQAELDSSKERLGKCKDALGMLDAKVVELRDDFSKRTVRSFYRSMLRAKVKTLDAKLGKRSFGAKDEWTQALGELQKEGVLTHTAATDTITLPAAV